MTFKGIFGKSWFHMWKIIVFKYVCINYGIENTDPFKIYKKCFLVILFCASIEYTFKRVGFVCVYVDLPTCTDMYRDMCLGIYLDKYTV